MIKSIGDNYRIYALIIVKTTKKLLLLNYGLSNATFETPNHGFTQIEVVLGLASPSKTHYRLTQKKLEKLKK
jgi:hypothetical protein